jgi:hypothetical protein
MGSRQRQRKPYHLQFSKAGHFTKKRPTGKPVRSRDTAARATVDRRRLRQTGPAAAERDRVTDETESLEPDLLGPIRSDGP